MSKQLTFELEAKEKLLAGVRNLAKAVEVTLGPSGRNVAIRRGRKAPQITKDGVTVAREIFFEDPIEDMGAQLVKEVAQQAVDAAGDGTTTATILARAIVEAGFERIKQGGVNEVDLARELNLAVKDVVLELSKLATACDSEKALKQVATISTNGDVALAALLVEAILKAGKHGVVSVENGTTALDEITVAEGMQFNQGYLSPHVVTNKETMTCELIDPYVLILDRKINNIREILPVLEELRKTNKPMLLVATEIEGEALATLVVNNLQNTVKVYPVKAPAFGQMQSILLEDMGLITNTSPVATLTGGILEEIRLSHLGRAKKILITKDSTTIIDGSGDTKARVKELTEQIVKTEDKIDKENLTQRLAILTNGVVLIKVGAQSDVELQEKKDRLDDALHAVRAAQAEGVLPGGGLALYRTNLKLKHHKMTIGKQVLLAAILEPMKVLFRNANVDFEMVELAIKGEEVNYGYDVRQQRFGNLVLLGVLDPFKVTRVALEKAVSVGALILTTECTIVDVPPKMPDFSKLLGG